MAIKIMANDSSAFTTIQTAVNQLETSDPEFMEYFSIAEQSGKDPDGQTVILKNIKRFRKDLNNNKYLVIIPSILSIDSFEFVKYFEGEGPRLRKPSHAIVIKSHITNSAINFVFVLGGFNDTNIRLLKADDVVTSLPDSEDERLDDNDVKSLDEVVTNIIND